MYKNKLLKNRRHGIGFLLVCLFTFSLWQHGVTQVVPYVDNISCQHTESHRLAFPIGTAFEGIHAYDMPSLEYKEMSYKMEKCLDENGNQ